MGLSLTQSWREVHVSLDKESGESLEKLLLRKKVTLSWLVTLSSNMVKPEKKWPYPIGLSLSSIFNKFLLAGGKFMPKLHLRQPGFPYSACGSLTKYCERIKKFRETGDLKHLYWNKLDKACFAHDAAYSDSKDLAKRTISDKILKDRAYMKLL